MVLAISLHSDNFRTTRVALQTKRWDGKVSAPEIDKFRGAMDKYNAEYGIFITTSDFTREAMKTAKAGTRIITHYQWGQALRSSG